jgi:hypothetical protein
MSHRRHQLKNGCLASSTFKGVESVLVVMDEYKQQLNGILQTLQEAGESL